ncbi:MAG: ABC transporter permease subunit, partial [Planctomycetota bacterium]|nr:ABC transporter permease subunit [Planctomycetota bacterium]
PPPAPPGRYPPPPDPLRTAFGAFAAARPIEDRIVENIDGHYWQFLARRYSEDVAVYNREHGTHLASYDDVFLERRVPAQARQREDWEEYVRELLPLRFIRLEASLGPAFREYLGGKVYANIGELNARYGTSYPSFGEVPMPTRAPASALEAIDWGGFLRDRARCPPERIEVFGPRQMFEAFVAARRGVPVAQVGNLRLPIAAADYHDCLARRGELRWEFTTRNYKHVLEYILLHGRGIANTVIYCLLAIGTSLVVNPLAAYAMSRYRLPGTYKVLLFCMATMAFPGAVTMIPSFLLMKRFPLFPLLGGGAAFILTLWMLARWRPPWREWRRMVLALAAGLVVGVWAVPTVVGRPYVSLLNTFAALVLPGMANGFFIFLLKGFFDSLPRELYEAADIDGAGEWTKFWTLTMNLSKPILAVIALGAFTGAYSAFMMALIIIPDTQMWTLMVWIFQLQTQSHAAVVYAALVLAAVPTFVVFVLCQNIIIRGIVLPVEKLRVPKGDGLMSTTTPLRAAGLPTRRAPAFSRRPGAIAARWVRRPTAYEVKWRCSMRKALGTAMAAAAMVVLAVASEGARGEAVASAQAVGVVSHVKVLSDKVPDVSSMEAWKKAFIKEDMTDQEKMLAAFRSRVALVYQDAPPRELLTGEGCTHDMIKEFNVYGYGMCCCASANIEAMGRYLGLEARGWGIIGHSVPEVKWNGAWHMLDASLINYFPKPDGTIAGVEEICAAVQGWLEKNPEYKGNDQKLRQFHQAGGWTGWKKGPELLAACPFYDPTGWWPAKTHGWYATMQEYDGRQKTPFIYEYGYSQGYEVNIQLRQGERLTRHWFNKGLHTNGVAGGGDAPGCLKEKVGQGPLAYAVKYGDLTRERIGSAVLEYDVPLADGSWRRAALKAENLAAKSEDGQGPAVHVKDAAQPGILEIRMPTPYVYLTGRLTFTAAVGQGGKVRVFFSDNNGLDWREIAAVEQAGEQAVDLQKLVVRRYDYRLRLVLSGKGTGLDALKIVHDLQLSQR